MAYSITSLLESPKPINPKEAIMSGVSIFENKNENANPNIFK